MLDKSTSSEIQDKATDWFRQQLRAAVFALTSSIPMKGSPLMG